MFIWDDSKSLLSLVPDAHPASHTEVDLQCFVVPKLWVLWKSVFMLIQDKNIIPQSLKKYSTYGSTIGVTRRKIQMAMSQLNLNYPYEEGIKNGLDRVSKI